VAPLRDRLRDADGPIAGMPGWSRVRKPDKTHCGGVAVSIKPGKKVPPGDEPLAAFHKIEFPRGLNFDPDPKFEKQREASKHRFDDFISNMTKVGADANDALLAKSEPLHVRAEQALAVCAEHGKAVAPGWWSELCSVPK
jgi:hypothetical protein